MHWLRENWFKVAVLILCLICILLVTVYVIKQQDIQKQQRIDTLNATCQKLANDKKKEIANDTSLVTDKFFRSFEYKYNKGMVGCILAYVYDATEEIFGSYSPYREMQIINLTTGEILFNKHPAAGYESLEAYDEFNKLQAHYMSSTTAN